MYTSKEEKTLSYYCLILGVSEQATPEEIKKAWYKKSLELHPDKNLETDTTEVMKELNEAYEILSAMAYMRKKTAESMRKRTNFHFFSQEKPKKSRRLCTFHFTDDWSVKIFDETHMSIVHPKLEDCLSGSILFSYSPNQLLSISLPFNFNKILKNRAWRQLSSMSLLKPWHLNNVDLCFGLPKKHSLWPDIMDCIFRLYKTPLALNQFMKDKLGLPLSLPAQELKNSIPDFYSYPDMHQHDKWETHLTEKHLFLKHPTRTTTAVLAFFNLYEPQFYITLPVNKREDAFAFFNEKLLPLVHEKPAMNLYEIVIKLDKSKPLDDILEGIFDFYEIPERIAKPIRQECLTSVTVDSIVEQQNFTPHQNRFY